MERKDWNANWIIPRVEVEDGWMWWMPIGPIDYYCCSGLIVSFAIWTGHRI
jgi:hypothetical protein